MVTRSTHLLQDCYPNWYQTHTNAKLFSNMENSNPAIYLLVIWTFFNFSPIARIRNTEYILGIDEKSKFKAHFVYRNLLVCRPFQLSYVIKLVLCCKKLDHFKLYKTNFIWLFDSTCIPLLKMAWEVGQIWIVLKTSSFLLPCMFF